MADKDFEGVWRMLSAASRERMEADARRIVEGAAKSEGTAKAAAEKQAKLMDMTMDQLKTLRGKELFVGLCTMAAREGKEEWEKLPRAQIERVEINVHRANVYVKVGDQVEVDHPLPLVLENGTWMIDMTGADKIQ
jgi:coenzyme F420-reducing hydrogenase alpha subunit